MSSIPIYILAALAEITGCFAFWAWLRLDRSVLWVIPGAFCLLAFAWLLTRTEADFAGRAYAAYGGLYILASLAWMWIIEGTRPDRWDGIGATFCMLGALVILLGPRSQL